MHSETGDFFLSYNYAFAGELIRISFLSILRCATSDVFNFKKESIRPETVYI